MLNLLRHLCLGAGNAASRGMSSTAVTAEEQLFACLFPGQGRYSADRAAQLAGKLREVADSLHTAPPQQEEQPRERLSKRARKERRYGKGEGWRGSGGGGGGQPACDLNCSTTYCPESNLIQLCNSNSRFRSAAVSHRSTACGSTAAAAAAPTSRPPTSALCPAATPPACPACPARPPACRPAHRLQHLPEAVRGPGAAVPRAQLWRLCAAGPHAGDD